MKQYLRNTLASVGLVGLMVLQAEESKGQYIRLIEDDFSTQRYQHDLSKLLLWGNNSEPTSAFQVITHSPGGSEPSFSAKCLTDTAMAYTRYTLPNGIKTATAVDYTFPTLNRDEDSIRLEFDLTWSSLDAGGENGRVVVAFMHDYPAGGPEFGNIENVDLEAPYGRPAYNWRVLGRNPQGTNNYAHLFYGGGKSRDGEYEIFNPTNNGWWLPGFISMPTGLSPGTQPYYPAGPGNSWRNFTLGSATQWQHFIFKLKPETAEIWFRKTSDAPGSEQLVNFMYIPKMEEDTLEVINKLNTFYGTSLDKLPPLYNWFNNIKALRFFWNGGANRNAFLANVTLDYSGDTSTTSGLKPLVANSQIGLRAYPNPATEQSSLLIESKIGGKATLDIVSVTGKLMERREIEISGHSATVTPINLSSLSKGVYWVNLTTSGGVNRLKLIKE